MADFILQFKVTRKHIDTLNHVNNVVYVNWMEEIADKHWKFLTNNTPIKDIIWVVLKHDISYFKQAFLNDVITAKTKVGDTKGFKSNRIIEFYNGKNLLVKAVTTWGCLDAKTNKPKRLTESILKILKPLK